MLSLLLLHDWLAEKRRLTLTQGSADRHSARQKLAQHEVEDAAVAVVEPLVGGIDPYSRLELDRIALGLAVRLGGDLQLAGAILQRGEVEGLLAAQPERLDRLALRELERQYAHPDQVGAVDALVALGDHEAHAQEP